MLGEILRGPCSHFGGPDDLGVDADEPLAFLTDVSQRPEIFLDEQPEGTTGLARRLDPASHYIAMRFDYDEISKEQLRDTMCLVRSPETTISFWAYCADWGPHEDTGRIADISPGLMDDLGIETDDPVEVIVVPPQEETS
jgi:hypothetical protein